MHERLAKKLATRAFWKGVFFGVATTMIFGWITAQAHYNCDPECGYVTEINLETGDITQTYVCDN